ncbi:calmodulin-like 3 [Balamuthia mandrillaris]
MEDQDNWREAFRLFDTDGDGRISSTELGELMKSLDQNPTGADIREIMKEQGSDKISCEEFIGVMERRIRAADEALVAAFSVFERGDEGYVSAAELRHLLSTLGDPMSQEEIEEMFSCAEVDSDGQFNYKEFIKLHMT